MACGDNGVSTEGKGGNSSCPGDGGTRLSSGVPAAAGMAQRDTEGSAMWGHCGMGTAAGWVGMGLKCHRNGTRGSALSWDRVPGDSKAELSNGTGWGRI